MMNLTYYIKNTLLLGVFCSLSLSIFSQVTLGTVDAPENFSALQLDESSDIKGLRLPHVSNKTDINTKVNSSSAIKTKAKGLFIYNLVSKFTEFWNGTTWLVTPFTVTSVSNGLTLDSSTRDVKLGGDLTQTTTIGIGVYSLNFLLENQGVFNVNNNFKIENSKITAKAETVTIGGKSEVVVSGTPAINKVSLEKDVYVKANSSILHVLPDSVALTGDIILNNKTSQSITTSSINSPELEDKNFVFANNTSGEALWSLLRSPFEIKVGQFLSSTANQAITNTKFVLSNQLELATGKWLIYARLQMRNQSANANYNLWFTLRVIDPVTGITTIPAGIGAVPDTNGDIMPQITYLLDVTQEKVNIEICASSEETVTNNRNWRWGMDTSDLGDPTFFAILLDKPIN